MGKGEGQGEASGHARGRGHKSRCTTNDICWVLVPTLVLGVPVLIAGIVIYFYWENKVAYTFGVILIVVACASIGIGIVLLIVFCYARSKHKTAPLESHTIHVMESSQGTTYTIHTDRDPPRSIVEVPEYTIRRPSNHRRASAAISIPGHVTPPPAGGTGNSRRGSSTIALPDYLAAPTDWPSSRHRSHRRARATITVPEYFPCGAAGARRGSCPVGIHGCPPPLGDLPRWNSPPPAYEP